MSRIKQRIINIENIKKYLFLNLGFRLTSLVEMYALTLNLSINPLVWANFRGSRKNKKYFSTCQRNLKNIWKDFSYQKSDKKLRQTLTLSWVYIVYIVYHTKYMKIKGTMSQICHSVPSLNPFPALHLSEGLDMS